MYLRTFCAAGTGPPIRDIAVKRLIKEDGVLYRHAEIKVTAKGHRA